MTERISKDLIEQGLNKGLITFQMESNNLTAKIGDYWFYICSEYDKTEKDFSQNELINMIHESVNSEPINDENDTDADECLYYKYFLEEHLTMSNERCMQLLNNIIDHVSCARNTSETIEELLYMGFEENELINHFGFCEDDINNTTNNDDDEED